MCFRLSGHKGAWAKSQQSIIRGPNICNAHIHAKAMLITHASIYTMCANAHSHAGLYAHTDDHQASSCVAMPTGVSIRWKHDPIKCHSRTSMFKRPPHTNTHAQPSGGHQDSHVDTLTSELVRTPTLAPYRSLSERCEPVLT
ncbi:hypothetical protein RJT34_07476 [Clitoria ternatea]|uniref:Uncharacterized protein n=1 Tax=Clitoria ternatea TaxID=43366 RepID=A0AAN9K536_CLITE